MKQQLGALKISRRTALYKVAQYGKRSTRKPNEWNAPLQALLDNPDSITNVLQFVQHIGTQRFRIRLRTYRIGKAGAYALLKAQLPTHRLAGNEDIRKQDGGIHAQQIHGQQGYVGRYFSRLAQ